ncbi:MAG TPA: hypothetical protein DCZ10_15975 [Pelotomaculum sp.]|nr:hypothetical protein [Pelotomaculum sp.]
MMNETKLRYVYKHKRDGDWQYDYFTLDEIESGKAAEMVRAIKRDGYELIARDRFIGVGDKNGVEVYEGDHIVCKQYIGGNWVDNVIEKGTVSFKDGAFYLLRKQGYYRPLAWLIEMDYALEVIGNIHEGKGDAGRND